MTARVKAFNMIGGEPRHFKLHRDGCSTSLPAIVMWGNTHLQNHKEGLPDLPFRCPLICVIRILCVETWQISHTAGLFRDRRATNGGPASWDMSGTWNRVSLPARLAVCN